MFVQHNVYWPVYKRLEKEVVDLMSSISFSDDQLDVYSMRNAELILRCAVEIESIAKDLYEQLGGDVSPVDDDGNQRDLYFDTDCLELLENEWMIGAKEIQIISPEVCFVKRENIFLTPLHKANKRGSSGCRWKRAYQSLKHNRARSIESATVGNLLLILGALFILNIYYRDELFNVCNRSSLGNFNPGLGSDIFSVKVFDAINIPLKENITDKDIPMIAEINKFIYVNKYTEKSYQNVISAINRMVKSLRERLNQSPRVQEFLRINPTYKLKTLIELAADVGGAEFVREVWDGLSVGRVMSNAGLEIVLNKGGILYAG